MIIQRMRLRILLMSNMKMTTQVMVSRRQITVYGGDSWKSQRIPPNFQLWTFAQNQLPSVVLHLWHSGRSSAKLGSFSGP